MFVAHLFVFVFKYLIKILTCFGVLYFCIFIFLSNKIFILNLLNYLSAIYELKKIEKETQQ